MVIISRCNNSLLKAGIHKRWKPAILFSSSVCLRVKLYIPLVQSAKLKLFIIGWRFLTLRFSNFLVFSHSYRMVICTVQNILPVGPKQVTNENWVVRFLCSTNLINGFRQLTAALTNPKTDNLINPKYIRRPWTKYRFQKYIFCCIGIAKMLPNDTTSFSYRWIWLFQLLFGAKADRGTGIGRFPGFAKHSFGLYLVQSRPPLNPLWTKKNLIFHSERFVWSRSFTIAVHI